ncbi:unnamed protein product [Moneuplotes crassus]|uniref:Uncharacterized protein n=1 Tax=Euplotes crassus TaxID=5936 RepID=A0AAD2D9J1_EUPCR|nr:unnamed protein product [Moneuplotes crassus]
MICSRVVFMHSLDMFGNFSISIVKKKQSGRGKNLLSVNFSSTFNSRSRRCTVMRPRAYKKNSSGNKKKKAKVQTKSPVRKRADVTKDEKLDYFYTPLRKDYVKEHEKFMSFDQEYDYQLLDWKSISNLILSDQKKPFKLALDKLNKIKCKRFDRKLYDKSDSRLKKSKFFASLMKASKRKIAHKATKRGPSPNGSSESSASQIRRNNFMDKILTFNKKNLAVSERRATVADGTNKNFIHPPDALVAPSETDMGQNIDLNSRGLQSSLMEVLQENLDEEKASEHEKKIEDKSEKESSKLSRVSSSSSSCSSATSISCKYEINVNSIEANSQRSLSKKLSVCGPSEIDETEQFGSVPPMKINILPDLSNIEKMLQSNDSSSNLTSYSSTSSKVSLNKEFMKKSGDANALLVKLHSIGGQHHRRSSITFNNALESVPNDNKSENLKKEEGKPKKSLFRKSHKNFNSICLSKMRESKTASQFKNIKSSYRSLFRNKKSTRMSRHRLPFVMGKSPTRKKTTAGGLVSDIDRRKTCMVQNKTVMANYKKATILSQ